MPLKQKNYLSNGSPTQLGIMCVYFIGFFVFLILGGKAMRVCLNIHKINYAFKKKNNNNRKINK